MEKELVILGGGPAGLSSAFFAEENNLSYSLVEASDEFGGNCRTIQKGDFLFDTGAHRWHDKFPEITGIIKKLLGDDLLKINVPSQIFHEGKWIDFPLAPLDLLKKLGMKEFGRAFVKLLSARAAFWNKNDNFESLVRNKYGDVIAEKFIINYSQKLWGLPADELSSKVSGSRLKGLNLKTFIIESMKGREYRTAHLDGTFHYPRKGFGQIFKAMEKKLTEGRLKRKCVITKILHEKGVVKAVEANNSRIFKGNIFINTLPLGTAVKLLMPSAPKEVKDIVSDLQYRQLRLAVIMLHKDKFSENASVYFPDADVPFTRIYEPKNRSSFLAPADKTCIVVEVPCKKDDLWWKLEDEQFTRAILKVLIKKSLIKEEQVISSFAYSVNDAYPVLEIDFEEKSQKLIKYLSEFENFYLCGRNALFNYTHTHEIIRDSKTLIEQIKNK
ncbi:MAG: FAD-dependent oxidoreductase [Cytophagaceae bacterium]